MLITLCYSVLTWMQSRQRSEIQKWVDELLLKHCPQSEDDGCSLVFIKDKESLSSSSSSSSNAVTGTESNSSRSISASSTLFDIAQVDSEKSSLSCNSTPKRRGILHKSQSFDNTRPNTNSLRQISSLPYNNGDVNLRRLLWQEDNTRAIVLKPKQIVELYEWTGFKGDIITTNSSLVNLGVTLGVGLGVDGDDDDSSNCSKSKNKESLEERSFLILLEAEPGLVKRLKYKKFSEWGEIVCWRCGGADLALILRSKLSQLIQLMHIFRIGGQIILDGAWRVFRLTTVGVEGVVGTEISPLLFNVNSSEKSLTPADLRRLSAGVYENSCGSGLSTPKSSISKSTSRHDITTIDEEDFKSHHQQNQTQNPLPNWYERSPRKRSVATLPSFPKSQGATPRRRSFCPGSLGGSRTSSILLCAQSLSLDEEDELTSTTTTTTIVRQQQQLPPSTLAFKLKAKSDSKSHENLFPSCGGATPTLLSPMNSLQISKSTGASPRRRSPNRKRQSKPPNILVLSDDAERAQIIGQILKNMLANDRYAIYDIRWDQMDVGGWSEQTALLVVTGNILPGEQCGKLLEFLGDGGRLLAWCCDTPPFGPTTGGQGGSSILEYGSSKKISRPVIISQNLWTQGFQKMIETTDSEGYSRPLTLSSWANVKGTAHTAVIQADGGALGGKGVFSQIQFEASGGEEDSLSLLSLLLSQCLGIDCTQIKSPEYTVGYLLGDHKKVLEFLASTPGTVQQPEITLEFVGLNEKGPLPSHLRLPIHPLTCPPNFSTLDYYNNLDTLELGRLVIFTHTVTSTSHVLQGHPLRHGIVVVATRQTGGRGRGRNVWLSPEGSALFSLQVHVSLTSQMGRRLSLVQHISALAAILSIENHKSLGLRVKWPNDIYAKDQKIGGVLVESTLVGQTAIVNIGIGVNVSNGHPTVCLNSVVHGEQWKPDVVLTQKERKSKGYLNTEQVIAKIITKFEELLTQMESKGGLEEILEKYKENWMHGNGEDEDDSVSVEVSEGMFTECVIVGIDPYGFLRVRDITSGHSFSVRPDGNSFDIANKLIAIKD